MIMKFHAFIYFYRTNFEIISILEINAIRYLSASETEIEFFLGIERDNQFLVCIHTFVFVLIPSFDIVESRQIVLMRFPS